MGSKTKLGSLLMDADIITKRQLNDSVTIKTKLEGAMEMTQQLMEEQKVEENNVVEDKKEAKKVVKEKAK